jgi:hypothetical protein
LAPTHDVQYKRCKMLAFLPLPRLAPGVSSCPMLLQGSVQYFSSQLKGRGKVDLELHQRIPALLRLFGPVNLVCPPDFVARATCRARARIGRPDWQTSWCQIIYAGRNDGELRSWGSGNTRSQSLRSSRPYLEDAHRVQIGCKGSRHSRSCKMSISCVKY